MTQPGGQIFNQYSCVTWFATDASGASWWPNLQSVQVAPPGGQNLQTMDETSNGGKVVYLQMAGGVIWWLNLQLMQVAPYGRRS